MPRTPEIYLKHIISNVNVRIGTYYKDYYNPKLIYRVSNIGIDKNTEKPMVIYQAMYGDKLLWIDTAENWNYFAPIFTKDI